MLAGILWLSSTSDHLINQNQVSELTKIDKMSMSDLVITLLKKKLLSRRTHETDSRAYSLHLTTKGRQMVLKAVPVVEGIDAQFFSRKTQALVQLVDVLNNSVMHKMV